MAIADRIYEILVKKGKDQKHLAELMGKHESELCKWLSGTHNFTLQTIARIEAVLGENILHVAKYEECGEGVTKLHVSVNNILLNDN